MKKVLYLYLFMCIGACCVILSACNNTSDVATKKRFPSTFLQTGNDNDHSYMSLKSYRLDNDHLKLELTGCGGEGTGIFLQDYVKDDALHLDILGECGVVVDATPGSEPPPPVMEKRTFTYIVSTSLEDQLNLIRLRALELGKQ